MASFSELAGYINIFQIKSQNIYIKIMKSQSSNSCQKCWTFDERIQIHKSTLNDTVLLILRVVTLIYFTAIYIWRFDYPGKYKSLLDNVLYMSNVGYYFTWLYLLITVQDKIFKGRLQENSKKFVQSLAVIALTFQVPITIVFWGFLYNDTMVGLDLYMEINVHIFPIVVLSIDMIMNSYPYHLWMYVFPAIAGTVYLLINLTYSLSQQLVYSILTWDNGISYGIVIGSYVLTFLTLGLCRLVSHCWKEKRLNREQDVINLQSPSAATQQYISEKGKKTGKKLKEQTKDADMNNFEI